MNAAPLTRAQVGHDKLKHDLSQESQGGKVTNVWVPDYVRYILWTKGLGILYYSDNQMSGLYTTELQTVEEGAGGGGVR